MSSNIVIDAACFFSVAGMQALLYSCPLPVMYLIDLLVLLQVQAGCPAKC